ncbi:MAG: GNAT family N-acetyltransferase [Coprobacillus sp.]|nr:GNAT family N-acetyltransferase [Coprobacillus sp.]
MEFETDRLILRKWSEDDAERLFLLVSDPDVYQGCGWPRHENVEQARRMIKDTLLGDGNWAIVLKESGELIGEVELRIPYCTEVRNSEEGELGFWLGRDYWHNGYMSEAVHCILDYGFNALHKINIYAGHFPENTNSKRLITHLGFKPCGTHDFFPLPFLDRNIIVEDYVMSRDDYTSLYSK